MKKAKLSLFLCAVLVLSLVLSACGDKTNFLLTLKSAQEMKRCELTLSAKAKISGSLLAETDAPFQSGEAEITVSGFQNDASNGKINLTIKVAVDGTTFSQNLGDMLIIDNVIYMDLSPIAKFLGLDSSVLPEGKTIIKLEDLAGLAGEEPAPSNMGSAFIAGTKMADGFIDILDKSAKDISPDVFYKDGDKYCFGITEENGPAFMKKLGDTMKSDFPALFENLISTLKESGDEDSKLLAEELQGQKGDLLLSINELADEMRKIKDSDFEGSSFLASNSLTGKEGSREYKMEFDAKIKEDSNINFSISTKEYTEAKELSVDESKVITMEEFMQAFMPDMGDYGEIA